MRGQVWKPAARAGGGRRTESAEPAPRLPARRVVDGMRGARECVPSAGDSRSENVTTRDRLPTTNLSTSSITLMIYESAFSSKLEVSFPYRILASRDSRKMNPIPAKTSWRSLPNLDIAFRSRDVIMPRISRRSRLRPVINWRLWFWMSRVRIPSVTLIASLKSRSTSACPRDVHDLSSGRRTPIRRDSPRRSR